MALCLMCVKRMNNIEEFAFPKKTIKPRSALRESMFWVMRDEDKTRFTLNSEREESAGMLSMANTYMMAFAVGYHFNKKKKIASGAINHVNVSSMDEDFKRLAVTLVLKRSPKLNDAEDVWAEINEYAEYGVEVLFVNWKKNKILDIASILDYKE